MTSSIISPLINVLDSRSTGEIASRLGLPDRAVSQGLETCTATLLTGMANNAGDPNWMDQLWRLVSQSSPVSQSSNVSASNLASAAINPGTASAGAASLLESGKTLLSHTFGNNQSLIFDELARSIGVGSGVVSSLMSLAAPLMLTSIGRLIREDGMNVTGLCRLLVDEGEGARALLPSGLSKLMSVPSASLPVAAERSRPLSISTIPEPTHRSPGWLWLIPLLLIPALLLWMYRDWRYRAMHPLAPVVTIIHPIVRPTIPGNVSLNIPRNTAEASLLAFVQDPTRPVAQKTWFDFNRLLFDSNSAELLPGSREPLSNIAAILKAYPNVHLMIGGHTDSSGSVPRNLKLSQDRAEAAKADLVAMGISPDRLEAKGYGTESPLADNSTAEGRARNRRVSMLVTQK